MKQWLHAFRLRTLPLAVSSILVGSALAYFADHWRYGATSSFRPVILVLALITAILLQILSNLANDLGDHQHGTDNADRVGPKRMVQSGVISPAAMKRAMIICGTLAFASGISLITTALGLSIATLVFLLVGLGAIGAAVKYTFGKNPYGYAGLGDISVFLFFGIVGVCGTYYLHSSSLHWTTFIPAAAFGLLSTGVLNVNNMRDIDNDRASGKRTLIVRMGGAKARAYHSFLVIGGIACLMIFTMLFFGAGFFSNSWWLLLFLLGIPGLVVHLKRVWSTKEPRTLDPQLKVLAMGTFATALLFSLGLILAV